VTDEKNPADRAIELFVFAPLGLALSARELLPELVERGRQQVSGQVSMARMIGQFAVKQGTIEAEKAFERARASAQSHARAARRAPDEAAAAVAHRAARRRGDGPAPDPAPRRPPHACPPGPGGPSGGDRRAGDGRRRAATRPARSWPSPTTTRSRRRRSCHGCRGSALRELEAVRAHEATHRGRKTILSKVAQLQAS
jgi:hypothetical protein